MSIIYLFVFFFFFNFHSKVLTNYSRPISQLITDDLGKTLPIWLGWCFYVSTLFEISMEGFSLEFPFDDFSYSEKP